MALADYVKQLWGAKKSDTKAAEKPASGKTQDRIEPGPAMPAAFEVPLPEAAAVASAPPAIPPPTMSGSEIASVMAGPMAQYREQRLRDGLDWATPEPRGVVDRGPDPVIPPIPATRYTPDGQPIAPNPAELKMLERRAVYDDGGVLPSIAIDGTTVTAPTNDPMLRGAPTPPVKSSDLWTAKPWTPSSETPAGLREAFPARMSDAEFAAKNEETKRLGGQLARSMAARQSEDQGGIFPAGGSRLAAFATGLPQPARPMQMPEGTQPPGAMVDPQAAQAAALASMFAPQPMIDPMLANVLNQNRQAARDDEASKRRIASFAAGRSALASRFV